MHICIHTYIHIYIHTYAALRAGVRAAGAGQHHRTACEAHRDGDPGAGDLPEPKEFNSFSTFNSVPRTPRAYENSQK